MNQRSSFFFFLFSFFFVKFNFLLLNEEILILICFSLFCFLVYLKLGVSIQNFFQTQVDAIKSDFTISNSNLVQIYLKKKKELEVPKNQILPFFNLKQQFLTFNTNVLLHWPNLCEVQLITQLSKKLNYKLRLEQQTLKLVTLIVIEKVKQILLLQKFCLHTLHLKNFVSSEKVYLREHLSKIR